MSLQKAIKFVQGSISTSDLVDHMKLVHLCNDNLVAENSVTKATYQLDTGLTCSVDGSAFVKAVKAAGKDAKLSTTKGGKLRITSKSFVSFAPITEATIRCAHTEGTKQKLPENFVEALSKLLPFIATDGVAFWAGGVLFSGSDLFATDSKTLIQFRAPWKLNNTFVLPYQGIKELIRIKENPNSFELDTCADPKFVTFHYEGGHTLTVYPLDGNWPSVKNHLDASSYKEGVAIDETFFEPLEKLKPFTDENGSVYLAKGTWRTSPHKNTGAIAPAAVDKSIEGIYGIDQLLALKGVATKINLSMYPEQVPFTGKKLRGVLVGRTQ